MVGSRIVSHRQHVGLQRLCVLAEVGRSFLGPGTTYQFVQDPTSGDSALAGSCVRVLDSLELTCAVGQLVSETVRAHHRVFRTGAGGLMFLCGAWSRVALECLQRGISVGSVVSAMREGLDVCLDLCKRTSVSIETLTVSAPVRAPAGPQGGRAGLRALKLSRHFCQGEPEGASRRPDVRRVAEGLSHGCEDAMSLVIRASQMQAEDRDGWSSPAFDVSRVVTCALPGAPEDRACVLRGCVVLLPAERASLVPRLQGRRLKVALINGDLDGAYRHLGFNRPAGARRVGDQAGLWSSSKEGAWLEQLEALLLRLEVNLILVSGRASESALLRCRRRRILAVEKVKVSVLEAFADATGAVPVTYATQLSQQCVGAGAKVAAWREVGRPGGDPWSAVSVSAEASCGLVTVVLTGCVSAKLQALEERFWACAYRLHHALADGALLCGAGATEMLCVRRLRRHAEGLASAQRNGDAAAGGEPYRGVVLQLMAEGLVDYVSTVMVRTGRFSKVGARTELSRLLRDHGEGSDMSAAMSRLLSGGDDDGGGSAAVPPESASTVYDCLSVKREAWRRALDLVLLVLQADAEVVTGIEQKADGSQDALMLL